MAPPSQGFHPWMKELERNMMPPTGKAAPTGVTIAKAFTQSSPLAKSSAKKQVPDPPNTAITAVPPPYQSSSKGINAPAARSSRTAASAATPSNRECVEPNQTPPRA